MAKTNITSEQLRAHLDYDRDTGAFTRRGTFRNWRSGTIAGTLDVSNGYIKVSIGSGRYYAHRLAWLYVTGEWPTTEIDHRDGVRTNNAWANLRAADRTLNSENRRRAATSNKLGVLGVCRGKGGVGFTAQVHVQGKKNHLGTFRSTEEAHAAYLVAKRRLHAGNTL